ncbi:MAG TPA: AAA family ATPase [Bacilli bacterium]|nr:AAA family ATPase [Bacilli bacterium]
MKLLSADIKNFGMLSSKHYDFNAGINSFVEENGSGKSTLAAFIKAMLYGMDSLRDNDKDFKERKHYAPFNGQAFGGALLLSHGGHEYRIVRDFDIKSATKDRLGILIDNEPKTFEREIGEELLGLDKETFERLLFITSDEIQMVSNGNIKKNLNSIIDNTAEGIDFDVIIDRLSFAEKLYDKRGDNRILNAKNKKKDLEEQIRNQETISEHLNEKYERRNKLSGELTVLAERQKNLSDQKSVLECWNTYEDKLSAIAAKEEVLRKLESDYPLGYPSEKEIALLNEKTELLTRLSGAAASLSFSSDKSERMQGLAKKFSSGYPSPSEMDELTHLVDVREKIIAKSHGINFADADIKALDKYRSEFRTGTPSEQDINELSENVNEYDKLIVQSQMRDNLLSEEERAIKNSFINKRFEEDSAAVKELAKQYQETEERMKSTPKFAEQAGNPSKAKSRFALVLLVASLVLVAVGVALIFVIQILGIILFALGGVTLIGAAFTYLMGKIDSTSNVKTNDDFQKQERLLKAKEDQIHQILTPYGIFTSSIYSDIEKYDNNLKRYREICKKEKSAEAKNAELTKRINILRKSIESLLNPYVAYQTYASGLNQLKDDLREYKRLDKSFSDFIASKKANDINLLNVEKEISAVTDKYGLNILGEYSFDTLKFDVKSYLDLKKEYDDYLSNKKLSASEIEQVEKAIKDIDDKYDLGLLLARRTYDDVKRDAMKLSSLRSDLAKEKSDAENYKASKNLIDKPQIAEEDYELGENIQKLTSERSKVDLEIDADERAIETLEDNKSLLESTKDEIIAHAHRLDILQKTEKELRKAQKNLDDKYVAPIMDKFEAYSKMLGDLLKVKIEMGRGFNILLNIGGELKSDQHLSAGQKAICALCFRLAMLDNIFNDETPFTIMDDPFVSLDKNNIRAVAALMKEISSSKQIIYFSCHESRKI